ncbi:hypothetical protein ACO0K7_18975 [Undibacterium sp. Ji67W]|uniref:hypothetical protein n=1 Tax=Undibacterium sp. Ji67W TaxID=3413042 RepID=UPI003BF1A223
MKNLFFVFLIITVLVNPLAVHAQALPAAQPDRVGRAISGTLQSSMQTRGFAANDPRFGNTLARISPQISGVAGTATAITVGAVTAPGWVSVAIAIGLGAVITYAVNLGLDALTNWLFRNDNKIDESSAVAGVADPSNGIVKNGQYWSVGDGAQLLYGGDGFSIAQQAYANAKTRGGITNYPSPTCTQVDPVHVLCSSFQAALSSNGAPSTCAKGSFLAGGVCTSYTFKVTDPVPSKTGVDVGTAVKDIPGSDLNKNLNPAIIAALANKAWQNAASQQGYDGLPYPQSNPVTATEVSAWEAQNPSYTPTVQDFVSPNPTSVSQPSPWALPQNPAASTTTPATTPNANTTNPASANPLQNLGPDPGTPAPSLEQTPTAKQILDPLLNLLPDLKNYSPSMSVGSCPRPTLNLFGHTQTMEAHCTILENNRNTIHTAMILAFSILALLIVLSA